MAREAPLLTPTISGVASRLRTRVCTRQPDSPMAAHDTTTSTIAYMAMMLARHRDWQDKLREEMLGLGLGSGPLPYERIGDLVLTEYAMKESLRLMAWLNARGVNA